MDNQLVNRTLVDYYRGEDEDWFIELGFHANPMKAYLYTVAILHDTVLTLGAQQHRLWDGNRSTTDSSDCDSTSNSDSRTAMYLRRFERETRMKRDTVIQDAIRSLGLENIKRAISKEEDTPIELMYMDGDDVIEITRALGGLFF